MNIGENRSQRHEAKWLTSCFGLALIHAMLLGGTGTASAQGRVTSWGRNDVGQSTVPADLSNVVAIEAGYNHSLALREDGRVIAWGGDWAGITNIPPDLTNAVTIAAGTAHNLAILKSGSLSSWGLESCSRCGVPGDLTNAVAVAATLAGGYPYSVALRTDGKLTAWGQSQVNGWTIVPPELGEVVEIAVEDGAGLALKRDGTIIGWGDNSFGRQNLPVGLSNITAIAVGSSHCLALKRDGTIVGWGDNSQGQITIPTGLSNVVAVSAGVLFSVALNADGSVVAWGYNDDDRATVPPGLSNVAAISAGGNHAMALSWDGPLVARQTSPPDLVTYSGQPVTLRCAAVGFPVPTYQWKLHGTNLPGATSPYLQIDKPKSADSSGYSVVVSNTAGESIELSIRANIVDQPPLMLTSPTNVQTNLARTAAFSVQADGSLPLSFQWLHNGEAIVGATNGLLAVSNLSLGHAGSYSVLVSNAFGIVESSVAVLTVAPIAGWGRPFSGCFGSPMDAPINVSDPAILEAGYCRSLVVTRSRNLVQWGAAWDQPYIPIPEGLIDVVSVAEAQSHAIGLRSDGTTVIWGSTGYTNQPAGLREVVAIAAGRHHDVALKKDGTVVAWNYYPFQPSIPEGLTNVVAISACDGESLALRKDGSVLSWGLFSQLVVAPLVTNAIAIAAGGEHHLVLRADGTVLAWGDNGYGATNVPASLSNVVAISAGSHHSVALQSNGKVVVWGTVDVPGGPDAIAVPLGLTNIISISAGSDYNLAMAGDSALSFWRQPVASNDVIRGHTNILFAAAMGMPPIHYQWRCDGTNIPGANRDFLFLEDLNQSGETRTYSLLASNAFGTITSDEAVVRVVDSGPFILNQPISVTTNYGRLVRFSVAVDGSWPLSYQWKLNGVAIAGATNSALVLTNVNFGQEGNYSVSVGNAFGVVSSDDLVLRLSRVVSWGRDTAGETNPPPSLTNIVAISAGYYHGLALRDDGTVVSWGARTNTPAGLSNVIQIDSGTYNSVALRSDGTVAVWGDTGSSAHYTNFAAGLSNIVYVAAGDSHFAALRNDGKVVVWASQGAVTNVPLSVTNVVAIAAAANYCLALRENGTVAAWGIGPTNVPLGLTNVAGIVAGGTTAAAIRGDGTVLAWSSSGVVSLPAAITNMANLAIGSSYGLGLRRDGIIVPWGSGFYGQTNVPRGLSNIVAIATDADFSIALVEDPSIHRRVLEPTFGTLKFTGKALTFSGMRFTLESSDSLSNTNWKPVATILGRGAISTLSDTNLPSVQKFYRVRRD